MIDHVSSDSSEKGHVLGDIAGVDLLEVVPDGVLVVDGNGLILAANPAIEVLFGYEPGELVSKPLSALIPERYHPEHDTHLRRYWADPNRRPMGAGLDLRARRKDGTEFPVEIALGPIKHEDSMLTVAVIRDVSEHHEQLAAIQSQRDHRDAFIQALFAGLAETDRQGRIIDVTERFCEMVGRTRSEILSSEPPYPFWPETLETHEQGHTRAVLERPDGSRLNVEASASPIRSPEGDVTGRILLLLDVSETVKMAEQLRAAQTKIVLLEERDRIARDLHDHVIQRVLATGMALQAMEGGLHDHWASSRIRDAVNELDEVIRELRAVIFRLTRHNPNLEEAIRETVQQSGRGLRSRPVLTFDGATDAAYPDEIVLHATAVVRELLSNTVRHASAHTVEVSVTVNGSLTITVSDDGVGMPPDRRSGNGLVNIEERAQVLGGKVLVASEVGRGTTVTWEVPIELSPVTDI